MIDLALEHDFNIYFRQPIANEDQDHVLEMMRHPRSLVTFSDSGAHVAQIMDSSLQTHLLSYWVRERQAFTLEQAVRRITYDTATAWGLHDRGLIRRGLAGRSGGLRSGHRRRAHCRRWCTTCPRAPSA
jgi:N-acyl-D-amino-acid deacylase